MILLRSLVYMVFFFTVTAVYALSSVFARPLGVVLAPTWPHVIARGWARAILGGLRVICGIRYEVEGRENLPEGPALVTSMHQSAFDTIVWLLLVHNPAYVLKIELTRIPLFGAMCALTGMIAVDRDAGSVAIRTLLRAADAVVAQGRKIVIFPEGTRVAYGKTAPLQPGIAALASHTKLPVVPVVTDSGRLWGRKAFLKRPGVIHIAIQPALPAGMPRRVMMETLAARFEEGFKEVQLRG